MNFLASIAAAVIEKLLLWFANIATAFYKEQKQLSDEAAKAADNLKKLEGSKTEAERRKNAENLLNGN